MLHRHRVEHLHEKNLFNADSKTYDEAVVSSIFQLSGPKQLSI